MTQTVFTLFICAYASAGIMANNEITLTQHGKTFRKRFTAPSMVLVVAST
jgi:hypothetical protein